MGILGRIFPLGWQSKLDVLEVKQRALGMTDFLFRRSNC